MPGTEGVSEALQDMVINATTPTLDPPMSGEWIGGPSTQTAHEELDPPTIMARELARLQGIVRDGYAAAGTTPKPRPEMAGMPDLFRHFTE
jgi:hypothetical protein